MTEQPHPHKDRKQRQKAHYTTSLAQIAHTLREQTPVQLRGDATFHKHTGVGLHPTISVTWAPETPPSALAFGSPSHATAAQCAEEGGSGRNDGQILLKWTTPQGPCAYKAACYQRARLPASLEPSTMSAGRKTMAAKADMCSQKEANARFWNAPSWRGGGGGG